MFSTSDHEQAESWANNIEVIEVDFDEYVKLVEYYDQMG